MNAELQTLHNLCDEYREEARKQRERAVIAEVRLHEARRPVMTINSGTVTADYLAKDAMTRCHYTDEALRRAFADGVDAALGITR